MQDKQSKPDEDRLWRAFLYVSGELSNGESDEFERLMLEDDQLCEAVIEATQLTSAVAGSRSVSPQVVSMTDLPPLTASKLRRGRWAGLVAICCCMFVVVVTSQFSTLSDPSVAVSETAEAEQLVDAWADSRSTEVLAEIDHSDFGPQDLEVPGWMMAAVSLEGSGDAGSAIEGRNVEADWF